MLTDMRKYRNFTKINWSRGSIVYYITMILIGLVIFIANIDARLGIGMTLTIEIYFILFSYSLFYGYIITLNFIIAIIGSIAGVLYPYYLTGMSEISIVTISILLFIILLILMGNYRSSDPSVKRKGQVFAMIFILFAVAARIKYEGYADFLILPYNVL